MGTCKVCRQNLGFFQREHKCSFCGGTICHDCAVKFRIDNQAKRIAFEYTTTPDAEIHTGWSSPFAYACPACYLNYEKDVQTMIQNEIMIRKENVRLYSNRYLGRLPKYTQEISIQTEYYRDKNEAENEMKLIAAHLGCRNVIDVRYNKKSEEDGNYIYSVFQYEGKGIK